MQTLCTVVKADEAGVLHLNLPIGAPNSEFEVVVVLQPKAIETQPRSPEGRGWPAGFFEETAGSIQAPTFRRHDHGESTQPAPQGTHGPWTTPQPTTPATPRRSPLPPTTDRSTRISAA